MDTDQLQEDERKKMLLEKAIKALWILASYQIEDEELLKLLEYDGAECDLYCLAEDIRIEFKLRGE